MSKRKRFLIGASALVITLLIASLWATYRIDAELKAEEEKLRALGIPLTVEELDAQIREIPDNAAPELDRAYELLLEKNREKGDTDPHDWIDEIEKDPKKKLEFASSVDPVFKIVEDASGIPQAVWTSDQVESKWLGLFFNMNMSAAMVMEAEVDRGNYTRALRALRFGELMAKFGKGSAESFNASTTMLNNHGLFLRTGRVLSVLSGDEAAIQQFNSYFENTPPTFPPMKWSLHGEAAEKRKQLRSTDYLFPPEYRQIDPMTRWMGLPTIRKSVEIRIFRFVRETYEMMPDDSSDWREFRAGIKRQLANMEADTSISGRIAFYLMNYNYGDNWAEIQAMRNAQIVTTRVMLFRLKNKRLPKTLAEAGAELEDCVNGKPLRYIPGSNSFKVYSVGIGGTDEGGGLGDFVLEIKLKAGMWRNIVP